MSIEVKLIDEDKLYTDLGYRFQYLCDFICISENDIKLIHGTLWVYVVMLMTIMSSLYNSL